MVESCTLIDRLAGLQGLFTSLRLNLELLNRLTSAGLVTQVSLEAGKQKLKIEIIQVLPLAINLLSCNQITRAEWSFLVRDHPNSRHLLLMMTIWPNKTLTISTTWTQSTKNSLGSLSRGKGQIELRRRIIYCIKMIPITTSLGSIAPLPKERTSMISDLRPLSTLKNNLN